MEEKANNTSQLLTAKTLAKQLSISTRSLWRYRSADRLPRPVQVGGAIRWRQSDIEQWISLGCPSRQEFEARKEAEKC